MSNRLQVGIDIHQDNNDVAILAPNGDVLVKHKAFTNNLPGYQDLCRFLAKAAQEHPCDGLDIAGEATGLLWFHPFYQLAHEESLTPYDPELYLFNPRLVHAFRKSLPEEEKNDLNDPQLVAERLRFRHPEHPLRFYDDFLPLQRLTRYRYHLVHDLVRQKSYFLTMLYLKASEFQRLEPFSDLFGATARHITTAYQTLDHFATMSLDDLADLLNHLGRSHFPDPKDNARKLQQVARDSYPLLPALVAPMHTILNQLLEHIRFLEKLLQALDPQIEQEFLKLPQARYLCSVKGYGKVYPAGIVAEIQDTKRFLEGNRYDKKHKVYRPKDAFDAQASVAKWCGLWWPQKSSGDFASEDQRLAGTGNHYLRYYFIEAANCLRIHNPEYAAYYARKYKESLKHKHMRSLVLTARKLIRLTFVLLHEEQEYHWAP